MTLFRRYADTDRTSAPFALTVDAAGSVATSFGNVAAELATLPACLLVYTGDIAGQASASLDASVSVIDPVTYQEIRRVPTGKEPHHLYLSPDEKSLLVANAYQVRIGWCAA